MEEMPGKEFKIAVSMTLSKLQENSDKQCKNLLEKFKIYWNNIFLTHKCWKLKIQETKWKNAMENISSRIGQAEEIICELEDRLIKNTHSKERKKI